MPNCTCGCFGAAAFECRTPGLPPCSKDRARPAAMGRDRPGRLNSVLSVSCQKRSVRSTALLQLHHAGAVGRFTLFSAEVASSWSAPRLLKSSLFRRRSDSEHIQGTSHSCRSVRPASHLCIPGRSDEWHRTRIAFRSFLPHSVARLLSRMDRPVANFRSAGHVHSGTKRDHLDPLRPKVARHIRHKHEPRVQRQGLSKSRRQGLSEARSQRTTVGHSRQGSSGYVGPASSPHT